MAAISALTNDLSLLKIDKLELKAIGGINGVYAMVDTESKLTQMLDVIELLLKKTDVFLNVDFEGVDLCRTGQVCIGQFHVSETSVVYLVDFVTLDNPFELCSARLKTLMESHSVTKVFYDPRNDCDAIANIYDVNTANALDLQLAEISYRRDIGRRVRFVLGLGKTMDEHVDLPFKEKNILNRIKEDGFKRFSPKAGGSFEVFKERPLASEIAAYCAADVLFFDQLRKKLFNSLSSTKRTAILDYTKRRLVEHKQPGYKKDGREKAIAPNF